MLYLSQNSGFRLVKKINKYRQSSNMFVKLACDLVQSGSSSHVCDSLNYVCYLYNLNKNILNMVLLKNVIDQKDEETLKIVGHIKDLIQFRDQNPNDVDIQYIIDILCTN